MEFDEFVRQFRERTAQRMMDFEAALAKAESDMAKSAAKTSGKAVGDPGGRQVRGLTPSVLAARKTPGRRRNNTGPIQGVLKKS